MYNDATYSAAQTQRNSLRSALVTFATSTMPATVAACATAVNAMDPGHPMLESLQPEDARFYQALVRYVNELRAAGRYSGPALRSP